MRGVSRVEPGLAGREYRIGLAVVDRGGPEQCQAPVVVLEVVPVEERRAELDRLVV